MQHALYLADGYDAAGSARLRGARFGYIPDAFASCMLRQLCAETEMRAAVFQSGRAISRRRQLDF